MLPAFLPGPCPCALDELPTEEPSALHERVRAAAQWL